MNASRECLVELPVARRYVVAMKRVLLTGMSGTGKSTVLVERLANRTTNPYGKHPDELARVLALQQTVEPLLRAGAGLEADTSAPLDQVVASVLRLVQSPPAATPPE